MERQTVGDYKAKRIQVPGIRIYEKGDPEEKTKRIRPGDPDIVRLMSELNRERRRAVQRQAEEVERSVIAPEREERGRARFRGVEENSKEIVRQRLREME